MEDIPAYGATRERPASVTYADVERAALDILANERRPSVETVREALGSGSPATIATCLKRFWRDLGIRAQGDPAALTRLPSEIVEAVETIWQRSLGLAAQSAKNPPATDLAVPARRPRGYLRVLASPQIEGDQTPPHLLRLSGQQFHRLGRLQAGGQIYRRRQNPGSVACLHIPARRLRKEAGQAGGRWAHMAT